jgi:geranylgeranylglycerol-phosphate geranylgeranyltransferase
MNTEYIYKKLLAIFKIVRPLNMVLSLLGVFMGGWLVVGDAISETGNLARILIAALSSCCIGAASNALNDVFDVEIDRINRPMRPIPSGELSLQQGRLIWIIGTSIGILLSFFLSWRHVLIAIVSSGLLYLYSAFWKKQPIIGNIVVGLVIATAFIYGGWAMGTSPKIWILAAFAFIATIAREITKDIEDMEGDAAIGGRTLPIWRGVSTAQKCVLALLLFLILGTPLPYLWYEFTGYYLIFMLGVVLVSLMALWHLFQTKPIAQGAHAASRLLKVMMLLGMMAFYN